MKNLSNFLSLIALIFMNISASAQSGHIHTVAGGGTLSIDGIPATNAKIGVTTGITVDASGNIYVLDSIFRVKKIDRSGIITRIGGGGALKVDGVPATSAQLEPRGLCVDGYGNLFFSDTGERIRKIDATSGIITTVAGNIGLGFNGDGGPATATGATGCGFRNAKDVFIDQAGNFYIADDVRVRKIDAATGIITTIAGNGIMPSVVTDGVPATSTPVEATSVCADNAGNVYVGGDSYSRIRKIDPSGIITTIAGNGVSGYTGDGGPGTAAAVGNPSDITCDVIGNIYIAQRNSGVVRKVDAFTGIITTATGAGTTTAEYASPSCTDIPSGMGQLAADAKGDIFYADNRGKVRKMSLNPTITSAIMNVYITDNCSGADFFITTPTWTAGDNILTYFGDGTTATAPVIGGTCGNAGILSFSHTYNSSGVFSVKHVLYNGTTAIDSITYSYSYTLCNALMADFYLDMNGDCLYSLATDYPIYLPVTIAIDSNGVAVDTITSTGGFYYQAIGNPGDIYTLTVIAMPPGLAVSCPASGIISDTIKPVGGTIAHNFVGFNCSGTPGFDLAVHPASNPTAAFTHNFALIENKYCTPQTGTLSINMGTNYAYFASSHTPVSYSGYQATWSFPGMSSAIAAPILVTVYGEVLAPPYYLGGDTVNSDYTINPVSGDANPADNLVNLSDTVRGAYDPNFIAVNPRCGDPGQEMEYTIVFENTGNDTAHNIHVMDTLSAHLDPATIKIVAASSYMNMAKLNNGGITTLKFDMPNIMLPDSSHHNLNHGMIVYKIRTKTGTASGTVIPNTVGIYFDYNPVVMTEPTNYTIGCPELGVAGLTKNSTPTIYPNPTTDELTIKTANGSYSSLTISNSIGQVLLQQAISNTQTKVNVKVLPAGLYYVTIRGENGNSVQKFVKL